MGAILAPLAVAANVAGTIMQGQAQAAQYKAQAATAEQNAKLAARQGEEEARRGAREEEQLREQGRQFAGTQTAQLAASGGTVGGSALGVMADTASGIEQDAQMIRYNTLKSKWGFDVEAVNYQNQANAARAAAKNARTASYIGAGTTLLGGVASGAFGGSIGAKSKGGGITIGSAAPYVPPDSIADKRSRYPGYRNWGKY